jgi:hypothetical protein
MISRLNRGRGVIFPSQIVIASPASICNPSANVTILTSSQMVDARRSSQLIHGI